jgi:hypothetical protein
MAIVGLIAAKATNQINQWQRTVFESVAAAGKRVLYR